MDQASGATGTPIPSPAATEPCHVDPDPKVELLVITPRQPWIAPQMVRMSLGHSLLRTVRSPVSITLVPSSGTTVASQAADTSL